MKMRRVALAVGIYCCVVAVTLLPNAFGKAYTIGTIQIMDHPDLNNTRAGFKEALKEAGLEATYIENINPSGKIDGVKEAINNYVAQNVDMIMAITTPCAQTAVKATPTIPIVFGAVRDPVESGIIKSKAAPGGNATGTVLVFPVFTLVKLAVDIIPNVKKIVFLEDKNKALVAEMEQQVVSQAKAVGVDLELTYIASKEEVDAIVDGLKGKADCIIVNNNIEVMKAMDGLIAATLRNKIALITTNEPSVERGALATSAIDYFKEGKKAGQKAVKILKENVPPGVIPAEDPTSYRVVVNLKTAAALGVNVPVTILKLANRVID